MKVTEHLERAANPIVSVEIIPPRRGRNVGKLYEAIESVMQYEPPFIDITSHAADVMWEKRPDGSYKRRVKRKSPGTFGLCAAIKYKFDVDPVPHILCHGFSREETEDALIELNYLGVENVLAIRGDVKYEKPPREDRSVNAYACDLVSQIHDLNKGRYLDEMEDAFPMNFCVGVSAYPEKHFEAPSLGYDISKLKLKQDCGADYAVTQLFYDNRCYFDFVQQARAAGVTIPITPGLKILTKKRHLQSIPPTFFVNFPEELVERVSNAKDDKEVFDIGVQHTYQQSLELLEAGVKNLHFYVMQNTKPYLALMDKLKKHL